MQERFERLVALQDRIAGEENAKLVGLDVELLVQAVGGRKNDRTHRMTGRARDGRLVHFAPEGNLEGDIRPGDVVHTRITEAKPFFLIADSGITEHRRTRAGDMSAAGEVPTTAPIGVGLGLPSIGRPPQPTTPVDACGRS